jgi:hypothetical protein
MLHLERRQFQPGLDGIDDVLADVDVVAHRLLPVIEIGERVGRYAEAQGDVAVVPDLLQRAVDVLRQSGCGDGGESE